MSEPLRILVLDQHEDVRGYLASAVPDSNFDVLSVSTADDLLNHAQKKTPFVIFVDGDDVD